MRLQQQDNTGGMIGFVIMSHQSGGQLLRLVTALNRLYDEPPIACHHDFSQADLDMSLFPPNVKFVQPSRRTAWGRIMTVQAALDALALLYRDGGPDWFVLLGISDYPIMRARQVLEDLRSSAADVLLDYRSVGDPDLGVGPAENPALEHFDREVNRRIADGWYLATQLWVPIIRRKPAGGFRIGRATKLLPFRYPFSPFDRQFRCYNGSHWFTGSRKAADVLNNPTAKHIQLRRHFGRRAVPEESYYQTVLCNADLRIDRHNRRFERWNGGGAHPQWLTSADFDEMMASRCHFARKFKPDDPVLDQIDEELGISTR